MINTMMTVLYRLNGNRGACRLDNCERIGNRIFIKIDGKKVEFDIDDFGICSSSDIVYKWLKKDYSLESLMAENIGMAHHIEDIMKIYEKGYKDAYEKIKEQHPCLFRYLKKCIVDKDCKYIIGLSYCSGGWKDEDYNNSKISEVPSINNEAIDVLENIPFIFMSSGSRYGLASELIDLLSQDETLDIGKIDIL